MAKKRETNQVAIAEETLAFCRIHITTTTATVEKVKPPRYKA